MPSGTANHGPDFWCVRRSRPCGPDGRDTNRHGRWQPFDPLPCKCRYGASANLHHHMITAWHRLDRFLARLRPHREPLSLLIDGAVLALAWNVSYLFRLGFGRWIWRVM